MKKQSFTLAEVLITLGIIGIIAALTIPNLIDQYKKIETVARLQKSYNLIAQGFETGRRLYGEDMRSWDGTVSTIWNRYIVYSARLLSVLEKQIQFIEVHEVGSVGGYQTMNICGAAAPYKLLHRHATVATGAGGNRAGVYVVLKDGSCWQFHDATTSDTNTTLHKDSVVGDIWVDVNGGRRGPNILGKDLFRFRFYLNGRVVPLPGNSCRAARNDGGRGDSCASKIIGDGWQIKKDYPWNFRW